MIEYSVKVWGILVWIANYIPELLLPSSCSKFKTSTATGRNQE